MLDNGPRRPTDETWRQVVPPRRREGSPWSRVLLEQRLATGCITQCDRGPGRARTLGAFPLQHMCPCGSHAAAAASRVASLRTRLLDGMANGTPSCLFRSFPSTTLVPLPHTPHCLGEAPSASASTTLYFSGSPGASVSGAAHTRTWRRGHEMCRRSCSFEPVHRTLARQHVLLQ